MGVQSDGRTMHRPCSKGSMPKSSLFYQPQAMRACSSDVLAVTPRGGVHSSGHSDVPDVPPRTYRKDFDSAGVSSKALKPPLPRRTAHPHNERNDHHEMHLNYDAVASRLSQTATFQSQLQLHRSELQLKQRGAVISPVNSQAPSNFTAIDIPGSKHELQLESRQYTPKVHIEESKKQNHFGHKPLEKSSCYAQELPHRNRSQTRDKSTCKKSHTVGDFKDHDISLSPESDDEPIMKSYKSDPCLLDRSKGMKAWEINESGETFSHGLACDDTVISEDLPTIVESPDCSFDESLLISDSNSYHKEGIAIHESRIAIHDNSFIVPGRYKTHCNLTQLSDNNNPLGDFYENLHSSPLEQSTSMDTLVHSPSSSNSSCYGIPKNNGYYALPRRTSSVSMTSAQSGYSSSSSGGRQREWYEEDDEEEDWEEEGGGGIRESDIWIAQYESELNEPQQVPEYYSLDDFKPNPLPRQPEPRIYSNGFSKQLTDRTHRFRHSTGGHEFVRAKTSPNLQQEYFTACSEKSASSRNSRDRSRRGPGEETIVIEDEPILANGRAYQRSNSVDGKLYWRSKQKKKQGSAWTLDDNSSPLSPLGPVKSSSYNSTPQLYYVTPPKSMALPANSEGRLERSGSGRGGSFSRLARRLSQREKRGDDKERKKALRQRSVSLDCGDTRRPLSDDGGRSPSDAALSLTASPSMPSRMGNRHGNGYHSSPGTPRHLSLHASGSKKTESKEKKKRTIQDLQALFDAVEQQDIDRVKQVLETCAVDVNGQNSEELTPLDIAVFMNHVPMAKLLLSHGARENPLFLKSNEACAIKLITLVKETERKVQEIQSLVHTSQTANGPSAQNKESLRHWEYRLRLFKRMKSGHDQATPPEPPTNVRLSVSSPSSIQINFDEPLRQMGAVVTRYKVEWSCYEDFSPLAGELIIEDPHSMTCDIPNLAQGNMYYVRLYAWNIKGWSTPALPDPPGVAPTCWRDVDNTTARTEGKLKILSQLFTTMKNSRSPEASAIKDQSEASFSTPSRKSNVRKGIKSLFATAPKFQKTLKRGVYLAAVVCCDDRILVTSEDILPIVEVDENFTSASLNADFHWLMKIACTWEDVKSLRQDMDKVPSANAFHLRSKLLNAANLLQTSLGLQDLGSFYHTPIKDTNGSIVLVTVTTVRDTKCVSTTHCRWSAHAKLMKRIATSECFAAPEMLLQSTQEMLQYESTSRKCLPKGLYLGYLKLTSSVDLIRIMVPENMPNVLPHARVRDNAHVTKEEWEWLRCLSLNEIIKAPSDGQTTFQNDLRHACGELLSQLGIDEESAVSHRLYDLEVIELCEDVSFILLLPPADSVCNVPGNRAQLTHKSGYVTLPIKVFEMIHMCTYQYEFISRYCRLSSILEMDMYLGQQAQREAFSSEELNTAKERVQELASFQKLLDDAWKSVRWTMDIITNARDKSVKGGLPLAVLYAPPPSPNTSPNADRKSDIALSLCSDPGYHSDGSAMDNSLEQFGSANSTSSDRSFTYKRSHTEMGGKADCDCCDSDHGNSSSCDLHQPMGKQDACAYEPAADGILRIHPAYDTGLARGTNVKLQVTSYTTSREVINLVVQQLNKTVLYKGLGGPVYGEDELGEFCLVAVIGARERVLRDDFQPLHLQNPWTKGRLFVRLKNNILAALEQGQVTSV